MMKSALVMASLLVLIAAGSAGYEGYVRLAASRLSEQQAEAKVGKPVEPVDTAATATEVASATKEPAKPAQLSKVEPVVPSFDTVRISPEGNAVIAGRAAPNAEVVAMLNGAVVATAKAGASGEFVMLPEKPLAAGQGALSLESKVGRTVLTSTQAVAVSIKPKAPEQNTVAVLSPDVPAKIVQAPRPVTNSVTLDVVDYDSLGNILFSGRAQPSEAVRLYVDNAPAGEIKTGAEGQWNFKGTSAVTPGKHALRVDAVAMDGHVTSRIELPFVREEPAKIASTSAAPPVDPATKAPDPVAVATGTVPDVEAPRATRITIQPGNNLWRLSRELYGAGHEYTVIYQANKDQIRNPHLIYPGQILTAPAKAQN